MIKRAKTDGCFGSPTLSCAAFGGSGDHVSPPEHDPIARYRLEQPIELPAGVNSVADRVREEIVRNRVGQRQVDGDHEFRRS